MKKRITIKYKAIIKLHKKRQNFPKKFNLQTKNPFCKKD